MTTTSSPRRLQRKRVAGWRAPAGAIYVGRPTKYGNPYLFVVQRGEGIEFAIRLYRESLLGMWTPSLVAHLPDWYVHDIYEAHQFFRAQFTVHPAEAAQHELRGADLLCWCRLCPAHRDGLPLGVVCIECAPCHVSGALLEIANR